MVIAGGQGTTPPTDLGRRTHGISQLPGRGAGYPQFTNLPKSPDPAAGPWENLCLPYRREEPFLCSFKHNSNELKSLRRQVQKEVKSSQYK